MNQYYLIALIVYSLIAIGDFKSRNEKMDRAFPDRDLSQYHAPYWFPVILLIVSSVLFVVRFVQEILK